MEKPMNDIQSDFAIRVFLVRSSIVKRYLRADEKIAHDIIVDGKGDAIGGGRVVEKLEMQLGDFFGTYEVNSRFIKGSPFIANDFIDEFSHRSAGNLEGRLAIKDINFHRLTSQPQRAVILSLW
jgi:hypothetical protein